MTRTSNSGARSRSARTTPPMVAASLYAGTTASWEKLYGEPTLIVS